MVTTGWILIALGVAAAAWHVVTSLRIYAWLDKRNMGPSFLLMRLYMPKYAGEYATLTSYQTGRTGPLFWHWVISINVALVLMVVALILLGA